VPGRFEAPPASSGLASPVPAAKAAHRRRCHPARLSGAGPGLPAHVPVNKYADHLPLYRQSQIFERDGLHLDRSTLADWGEARSRSERAVRRTDRRVERAKRRTANRRPCRSRWPRPSGGTWRPDRRSSRRHSRANASARRRQDRNGAAVGLKAQPEKSCAISAGCDSICLRDRMEPPMS
jgi:hypothetical protein